MFILLEVYATSKDSKAQITGTGMIELKEGVNELLIEVIAANGEKKSYTLKVTREKLTDYLNNFNKNAKTLKKNKINRARGRGFCFNY